MSYLVVLRKFVAQRELLFLGRILNEVEQPLPEGFTKEAVRTIRKRYHKACKEHHPSKFICKGTDWEPEFATVNLWMQGHVFHDEPDKMDRLRLNEFDEPTRKARILHLLQFALNVTPQILLLQRLVKRILRLNLIAGGLAMDLPARADRTG